MYGEDENILGAAMAIGFAFGALLTTLVALLFTLKGDNRVVHYNGDPDPRCSTCGGTGIVNEGDPHFECECPCKVRIE